MLDPIGTGFLQPGIEIGRRLEVGMIIVSKGGNCPLFFLEKGLQKFVCIESMVAIYI